MEVRPMQVRVSSKGWNHLVLERYVGSQTKLDYWYCYNFGNGKIYAIEDDLLQSWKLKASSFAIKYQNFLDEVSLKLFKYKRGNKQWK